MPHHTNCNCFVTISWRKLASLHRWGFLWSVSGGSLWRLPHCWGLPARQSPALRPCPGPSGRSPSPGALFLQYPPPAGRNRRRNVTERYRNETAAQWSSTAGRRFLFLLVTFSYTVVTHCWPPGGAQSHPTSSEVWYIHPEELTSGAQYYNNCHIIYYTIKHIYEERQYAFQKYLQNDSRITDHILKTTLCTHTKKEQSRPDVPRLNNEDI